MAADAGEEHDVSIVLVAQNWQAGFDEVDLREEDCLELVLDEVAG